MTGRAAWDDLSARLAAVLVDLAEDEFVVVSEPAPPAEPRSGLLRRRPKPAPTRYVQFRRDDSWLYGECVGAALFGGDWHVPPADHARLRELGWLVPGEDDPSAVQPSYPNYWRVLARERAADAAAMAAASLEILGVEPSVLEWRRDG
jgi:hypothetical protein